MSLAERGERVLELRQGGATWVQIGDQLNLCGERVRQIYRDASARRQREEEAKAHRQEFGNDPEHLTVDDLKLNYRARRVLGLPLRYGGLQWRNYHPADATGALKLSELTQMTARDVRNLIGCGKLTTVHIMEALGDYELALKGESVRHR